MDDGVVLFAADKDRDVLMHDCDGAATEEAERKTLFSPIFPNNNNHICPATLAAAEKEQAEREKKLAAQQTHHHHTRKGYVAPKDPKQRSITEFAVASPATSPNKAAAPMPVDPNDPLVIMRNLERYEYTFDACAEDDFNPLLFIKLVPPLPFEYRHRTAVLPRKTRSSSRLSLVLDLDETLVHCSTEPMPRSDLTFNITANGMQYTVHARRRPFLDVFLREASKFAEVTVFTASQQVYAEKLLDLLDPQRLYIKHRLYRSACVQVEGVFLKDLSVLGRDLTQTVIVDNSPQAFAYQIENGIPIDTWIDEDDDTELLKLLRFLKEEVQPAVDVRDCLRRRFRIQEQIDALCFPEESMEVM